MTTLPLLAVSIVFFGAVGICTYSLTVAAAGAVWEWWKNHRHTP